MRDVILKSVVAAVFLSVVACTDRGFEPEVFDEGRYPASVGTQWVYARYDSVRSTEDTVTITITAQSALGPRRTRHIARYETADTTRLDTLFISGDTATLRTGNGSVSWIADRYVFPLYVGSVWSAASEDDSVWVREKAARAVPAGEFRIAYRLDRVVLFLNYTHADRIWVAPGYGVIQKHVRRSWIEPDAREQNDLWTLIDYTIPH